MTVRSRRPIGVPMSGRARTTSASSWVRVAAGSLWFCLGMTSSEAGFERMRRCLVHHEKNTRTGTEVLDWVLQAKGVPSDLLSERDVTLVSLEDGEGDVGRAKDAAQLGPGDELGQIERVLDHGRVGVVVQRPATPTSPADGAEAIRVARVPGDGEDRFATSLGLGRLGLMPCAMTTSPPSPLTRKRRRTGRSAASSAFSSLAWADERSSLRPRNRPIPPDRSPVTPTAPLAWDSLRCAYDPENRPMTGRSSSSPGR